MIKTLSFAKNMNILYSQLILLKQINVWPKYFINYHICSWVYVFIECVLYKICQFKDRKQTQSSMHAAAKVIFSNTTLYPPIPHQLTHA